MKLLMVVNPISGDKDKSEFLLRAKHRCRHYGISLLVFVTTGHEDLERLQQKIAVEKPDRLASVGGDGTFSLAVKATIDNPIPAGFIPMGSANGLARELGVSSDPEMALDDLLLSRLIVPMDILMVNEKHLCLHMGDVGLNAQIVKAYDADESRGLTTYGKHLINAISQAEDFGYQFDTGTQKKSGRAVMIGIGNGSKYGTGVPLNTVGNPLDGKFEVTVVEDMDADTIIRASLSVLDDAFLEGSRTKDYSVTEVLISLSSPQILQLDGEVIGEMDELSVKIIPGAIPLITNGNNPYLEREFVNGRD